MRLAMLAGCIALGLASGCDDAARAAKSTKQTMRETKQKVEFYGLAQLLKADFEQNDSWPTSLQPYLDEGTFPPSFIEDPWGNRILYTPPARKDGRPELRSMGPDGVANNGDDIVYEWTF